MENRKLNWRQACALLGCGRNRFYALIREGYLPAWRLPGMKKGLWVYEDDCRKLAKRVDSVGDRIPGNTSVF